MNRSDLTQSGAVQAVIFDLDGVLMDSEWLAFTVWQDMVREMGSSLPDTAFAAMTGSSAEECARQVMLASGVRFEIAPTVAESWQRIVERLKKEITPMDGARVLVQTLAARGIPLAVASNSVGWYVDDALRALKLETYFPIRATIDQVAQGKPAPDVYLEAARRLGVAPGNCLAVEDSLVGLQAARAAGMRVVAVPHPLVGKNGYQQALRVYHSLNEMLPELSEVMGW